MMQRWECERSDEAAAELLEINAKIAGKNEEIAKNELDIARRRAQVRVGDLEAQAAYADAYVSYQEVVAQSATSRAEVERLQREQLRDQTETELDRLFDISDRSKTISEQRINDERLSIEERKRSISRASSDITATYAEIEDDINEVLVRSFEARREIAERAGVEFTDSFTPIKIDDLLCTRGRNRDKRCVSGNRHRRGNRKSAKEALIERLQAVEDLKVAERDLADVESEYAKTLEDVAIQEQLLQDIREGRVSGEEVLSKLEQARTDAAIDRLKTEIALAEEGSTRKAQLQQELNDILLQLEAERIAKRRTS